MDIAFVTGGTGFVGANVARTLIGKGLAVRALVRKDSNLRNLAGLAVEMVEGDLRDRQSLKAACRGARYVFHVAADYRIWVPDPEGMYASNVDGTVNMIEEAHAAGVERIVHCSSVAAIRPPKSSARVPSVESCFYESDGDIVGAYKKSKWRAEKAALDLAAKGAPVVVVNPTAPIGPFDVKPTPTGRIIVDFLNKRLPSYIDTGLNLVHVRDVAEGHWLAATKGRVGERYILGGQNLTLKQALDLLAQVTGLSAPRFQTPYPLALAFAYLDSARARLTGGTPVAAVDAVRMARYRMFYDASKAVQELGLPQTSARIAFEDAVIWFVSNGYAPPTPAQRKRPEHS
ncbi:MAG: NAD-dependent epimerase/dehydratase family protein [Elusimicrobia bacterium]|nr:NAD-dependent epimerase/dehydratase family protein [Elusimicrobiota bacterium]